MFKLPVVKLFAVLFAGMAVCQSCQRTPTTTPTSGTMTMCCDNSFQNIMEQEIDVYEYRYPKAHILCRNVSQQEALDSLLQGNTRTIVIGRELTAGEKRILKSKNLTPHWRKIAVDAVALIVNEKNPVDAISMEEISLILSGQLNRWEDVQPEALNRKIDVVFDSPGSGLATYMADSLLHGKNFGPNVISVGSVEKVIQTVKDHPGAIGIVGVSWLTKDLHANDRTTEEIVKELTDTTIVDGFAINERMENAGVKTLGIMRGTTIARRPYQQNIYDGSYPLTRPIYMITVANPGGLPYGFYSFVNGVDGQRLIMRTGILPARVNSHVIELVN